MTVGAAVLDWLQPVRPAHHSPGRQLIAQFREAIHQPAQGSTIDQRWHAIRIDPQHGDSDAGAKDSHIIVERDGNWRLTGNWRTQSQLGDRGVVRIRLRASAHSNQVARPQWQATTQLIRGLQQMCAIPSRRIILNDTLALPPLPSPPPSAPWAN